LPTLREVDCIGCGHFTPFQFMKIQIDIKSALVGLVFCVVAALCIAAASPTPRSFEYTVVSQHGIFDGAKMLNEYGRSGWQVVSFNERESGTPNQHYTVILMREK